MSPLTVPFPNEASGSGFPPTDAVVKIVTKNEVKHVFAVDADRVVTVGNLETVFVRQALEDGSDSSGGHLVRLDVYRLDVGLATRAFPRLSHPFCR